MTDVFLASATAREAWFVSADKTEAVVTGRTRVRGWKKLNPIWWFLNDGEPLPPKEYLPGNPLRVVLWYVRNPFQNFGQYVAGVYDRNYTVYGTAPVLATTWFETDTPERRGFKFSVIRLGYLRLPFVSYVGKRVLWYAGWQFWGYFGFKWNLLNSKIQVA